MAALENQLLQISQCKSQQLLLYSHSPWSDAVFWIHFSSVSFLLPVVLKPNKTSEEVYYIQFKWTRLNIITSQRSHFLIPSDLPVSDWGQVYSQSIVSYCHVGIQWSSVLVGEAWIPTEPSLDSEAAGSGCQAPAPGAQQFHPTNTHIPRSQLPHPDLSEFLTALPC